MLYETTTGASGLLPGTRGINRSTSRPPCPADREEHHFLRLPFLGEISFRFCLLFFRIALF